MTLRRVCGSLLLSGLLAGCAFGAAGPGVSPDSPVEPVEQRILVMIADPEAGRIDLRGARSGPYRQGRSYSGPSPRVARVLEELAADYSLQPVDGWEMRSLGVYCGVFAAAPRMPVEVLIATLAEDARVESAQPMQRFELETSDEARRWDDPYWPLQHALEVLRIAEAHRWSTGRGIRVAVVDSGIDVTHPDLKGRIVERRDFTGTDGSAHGDRHGTAVAGVIASAAGNRRGIVGVAPDARLLALQACRQQRVDGHSACTSFSLARAVDYAITSGSDVLNLSVGGPHDRLLERLLEKSLERGIVVVTALSDAGGQPGFPASMPGVIAVGDETSPPDIRWLIASGLDVLTLVPEDGYDFLSGSSLAAAHVSGIVALLLERMPELDGAEITRLLTQTSQQVERNDGSPRSMVDACAALAELSRETPCSGAASLARAAREPGAGTP